MLLPRIPCHSRDARRRRTLAEQDLGIRVRRHAFPEVQVARARAISLDFEVIVDHQVREERLELVRREEPSRAVGCVTPTRFTSRACPRNLRAIGRSQRRSRGRESLGTCTGESSECRSGNRELTSRNRECDAPLLLTNYTFDYLEKQWADEIDFVICEQSHWQKLGHSY